MHLSGDFISPLARHRRLWEVLLKYADEARSARIEERLLFSATHLAAFFPQAIKHVSRAIWEPFDFVVTARINNSIGDDYIDHISTYLRMTQMNDANSEPVASFAASSIILDAYPPGMHSRLPFLPIFVYWLNAEFAPSLVFRVLYRSNWSSALAKLSKSEELANRFCQNIESHIDFLFPNVDLGFETSIGLHRHNSTLYPALWSNLKSNKTCLYCLRRSPELALTCGHSVCDVCLLLFGRRVQSSSSQYELAQCILCVRKGTVIGKLKPPTAAARILSIDGGGVRGVIPLEYLNLLQEMLGPGVQLQDFFDLAFGTSSGGLIVMGLFMKRWDVKTCIKLFNTLVRDFFSLHSTKGRSIIHKLRKYLRCWLSDCYYDAKHLEQSLKNVFGEHSRMFDWHGAEASGSKVAVTATTISDAFTYVFSNYNGAVAENKSYGTRNSIFLSRRITNLKDRL